MNNTTPTDQANTFQSVCCPIFMDASIKNNTFACWRAIYYLRNMYVDEKSIAWRRKVHVCQILELSLNINANTADFLDEALEAERQRYFEIVEGNRYRFVRGMVIFTSEEEASQNMDALRYNQEYYALHGHECHGYIYNVDNNTLHNVNAIIHKKEPSTLPKDFNPRGGQPEQVIIDYDKLADMVAQRLSKKMLSQDVTPTKDDTTPKPDEKMITAKQVAHRLNCKVNTIYKRVKLGMPYHLPQKGKIPLMFKWSEVLEYIEKSPLRYYINQRPAKRKSDLK